MKNMIFDLYGTLVDVHTDEWSDAFWQRSGDYLRALMVREIDYGRDFHRLLAAFSPDDPEREIDLAAVLTAFFRLGGADYSQAQIAAIGHRLRQLATQKLRLYPGTLESLEALRTQGKQLYLLSNAQALFTVPELEELGLLPYFDGVELSSDFGWRKPSPLFFNHLIDKYGLVRDESVYIGNDYASDICGAERAGLQGVYIRTETSPIAAEPETWRVRCFLDGSHASLYQALLRM